MCSGPKNTTLICYQKHRKYNSGLHPSQPAPRAPYSTQPRHNSLLLIPLSKPTHALSTLTLQLKMPKVLIAVVNRDLLSETNRPGRPHQHRVPLAQIHTLPGRVGGAAVVDPPRPVTPVGAVNRVLVPLAPRLLLLLLPVVRGVVARTGDREGEIVPVALGPAVTKVGDLAVAVHVDGVDLADVFADDPTSRDRLEGADAGAGAGGREQLDVHGLRVRRRECAFAGSFVARGALGRLARGARVAGEADETGFWSSVELDHGSWPSVVWELD